ncbi:hypothetical protein RHGRI_023690 [Rhododendron griersonianum]|uniref:CCHC-type domain-containing protein n=1 Tax=Rhododendron griersonianum TaxID=479676 RepID=A0AAV6J880_9ERIC|nr:hypothetical protein RHGRI_023690 [Rhododendron griersonianum]
MSALKTVDWQWQNAVAGSVAGLATVAFSHPLDVVRTRFQVSDGRTSSLALYKNTPHALWTIARTEGLRGLYAGFYPAVLGSTISWGLYFFFYSKAKERYSKGREELTPGLHLASAAEAGALVTHGAIQFTAYEELRKAVVEFRSADSEEDSSAVELLVLDRIKSGNGWNQGNEGFDGGDEFDGSTVEGAGGENSALAVQSENRGRTSDGRSGGNNRSGSSSRGKVVQCYSCKEFGHVKRDCPLRKNKGKKFDDASSASSLVVADDGDLLTVSEGINTSSRDEWTLDSGCTMHNTIDYATLGASSKLAAILLTYPFQVIRSRLQQRPSKGGIPIYMDSWHVVKETARVSIMGPGPAPS